MEDIVIDTTFLAVLILFPLWKIYSRAGLIPYLSLTLLIPGFGFLIATIILAASKWDIQSNN
jgi:hypothetical protein